MQRVDLIKWILHVSFFTIIFDGLVGILTFIDSSSTVDSALTGIWILKLFLSIILSLNSISGISKSALYVLTVLLGLINLARGFIETRYETAILSSGFFCLIIIFGGASGFAWFQYIQNGGKIVFPKKYVYFCCFSFVVICLVYFMLFITGTISYFGMGVQSYLISGLLLSSSQRVFLPALVVLATILTGKRGLLMVLVMQNWQNILSLKRRHGMILAIAIFLLFILFTLVASNLNLLDRFNVVFEVSINDLLNYEEPEANHRLYLATSGRSNEVIALLRVLDPFSWEFWFGYPSDFYLTMENVSTNESWKHHYLHISPLNYIKHFGILLGSWLFLIQVRVVIFAIRYGVAKKDIGLNLFVGYFCSMFFGAIVIIDILYWITFFYSYLQFKNLYINRYKTKGR